MIWPCAAAIAGIAGFAPPLDTKLLLISVENRDDGVRTRQFRTEREIRFARDGAGYRVSLTMRLAHADGAEGERQMFAAANRALLNLPLSIRLDGNGRLIGVDDIDRHWQALTATDLLAGFTQERREQFEALIAPLRAMSPERRAAFLATPVTDLLATDHHTEAKLDGNGCLTAEDATTRTVAVASGGSASVSTIDKRRTDPASGMVVERDITMITSIGKRILRRVKRTEVEYR